MKILMISGKAGNGKTELASFLKEELEKRGDRALMVNFADVLKFFLTKYYGWTGKKDISGRNLLQTIGSDLREEDDMYWADIVSKFVNAVSKENNFSYCLIADWRYANELKSMQLHAWLNPIYTIRVNRINEDGSDWINPNMTEEARNHSSETELDSFKFLYYIENKSLEQLHDVAKTLLEYIDNGVVL